MSVSKIENPADGSELTIIKGVVERITFKEAVNDKFGATHRASVLVDGEWVGNISLKTKEGYDPQVRFNNGNNAKPDWQTLEVGDEARFVVTENPYNGKVYYNGGTSKIKLVKKGAGAPKSQTAPAQQNSSGTASGSGNYAKKDFSGVKVGHCINAAMNLLRDKANEEQLVATACLLHDVSEKVKAAYAKQNPAMSEYDVGAASGQSVLTACKLVKKVEDVERVALSLLSNVVPAVTAYVKGEVPKQTEEVSEYEEQQGDEPDDFLDDVPF